MSANQGENQGLQRALKPIHLWAISVGMVISGQYFGWNYGFEEGGVIGLILAALFMTIFYTAFMFSYAELSTSIPHAGGPSAYARRAMGPFAGFMTGIAVLIEFVFAPPAIAVSTGAYLNFLFPAVNPVYATVLVFIFFILINMVGVKGAALIEMVATILALTGLAIYYGAGVSHIKLEYIINDNALPHGLTGMFMAIPFAIWFYLAIEGGAMAAEEVKNPQKDIPKGFIAGISTLALCTVGTLIITAGLGGGIGKPSDNPLPEALTSVYGDSSILPKLVAFIGLAGLIASLHGIIIGYSRQTFALSRAGYLPKFLSKLSKRHVPTWGLVVPGAIGVIAAANATFASQLIILAVFGAAMMYCLTLVSLFILRRKEPNLNRPFKVSYPWVPGIAIVMGAISLFCVVYYSILPESLPLFSLNVPLLAIVAIIFAFAIGYYYFVGRHRLLPMEEEFGLLDILDDEDAEEQPTYGKKNTGN
ncbi:ethanolamine:proton symporter (EAT family) [Scopulibacillus darangshiensis]|uniref:Ethanolamine:proton symporter (EAT family) n=1 Tax=Scopulibacillus darangshiensis TaxID=442528 RepID=A0A4R2PAV8_9BACL|nr:ethanolamine permease [Scopulibacillus darangshiensis]TCP31241.1 ethanolamine:proton symporter (EAT family) [Scopulibacillus darangshiensis]